MTKTSKTYDMTRDMVPERALVVMDGLRDAGFECFVVGGCVRDTMAGETPHDWDLTTNATPDEMKAALPHLHAVDTGLAHGTVTFMVDGEGFETTTFRVDGEYSDGRHPDEVVFTKDVEEDLARRDFTVNAMAWNDERGLVDPFNGAEDLANGVLRAVGNANDRFDEDGLRVMRAVRFAAVKGFDVEEETAKAVHAKVGNLEAVSRERVATELMKMLSAEDAGHMASVMDEFRDVLFSALPEMAVTEDYDQGNKHHAFDLWHHCLATCAGVPAKPTLRLAALLHDVGKPEVREEGDDGNAHYFGHMDNGAELAEKMCRRLKMSNEDTDYVRFMVKVHDRHPSGTSLRSVRRFYAKFEGDEERLADCLDLMRADVIAHGTKSSASRLARLEDGVKLMNSVKGEMNALKVRDLDFGGNDLMAMGYEPGPDFSRVLNALLSEVVDGTLSNDREALAARAVELMDA